MLEFGHVPGDGFYKLSLGFERGARRFGTPSGSNAVAGWPITRPMDTEHRNEFFDVDTKTKPGGDAGRAAS